MIMKANGSVMTGHETLSLHAEWERVKEWAKRTATHEKLPEVAVAAVTIVLFGVLFSALYNALHNYTVVVF